MNKKQLIFKAFFTSLLLIVVIFLLMLSVHYFKERKIINKIKNLYTEAYAISQEAGGFDSAEEEVKLPCYQIIELSKSKIFDYTILGFANYVVENDKQALFLLEKAIELKPQDAVAYTFLAHVYLRRKNYDKALDEINTAYKFKNNETLPLILETYGLIYLNMNNKDKAREYFEKAIHLERKNIRLLQLLVGTYFEEGNYNKAIEICKNGLEICLNDPRLLLILGSSYSYINEPNKAVETLEKARHVSEGQGIDLQVAILLALTAPYISLNKADSAEECLLKIKELDPKGTICQDLRKTISLYTKTLKDFKGKGFKKIRNEIDTQLPIKVYLKNGSCIGAISVEEESNGYMVSVNDGRVFFQKTEIEKIVDSSFEEREIYKLKKQFLDQEVNKKRKEIDDFLKEYHIPIGKVMFNGSSFSIAADVDIARRIKYCFENKSSLDKEIIRSILDGKVTFGMTKEQVIVSWGQPEDVNRTVTTYGVSEQWIYGDKHYLYFEDGVLTSWQD
jgi:tetratricopeptide (TPR) repeat protein